MRYYRIGLPYYDPNSSPLARASSIQFMLHKFRAAFLTRGAPECWVGFDQWDKKAKRWFFPLAVSDDNPDSADDFENEVIKPVIGSEEPVERFKEDQTPKNPSVVLDPKSYYHILSSVLIDKISREREWIKSTIYECKRAGGLYQIYDRAQGFLDRLLAILTLQNVCSVDEYNEVANHLEIVMTHLKDHFAELRINKEHIVEKELGDDEILPEHYYMFFCDFFKKPREALGRHFLQTSDGFSPLSNSPVQEDGDLNELFTLSYRLKLRGLAPDQMAHLQKRLSILSELKPEARVRMFLPERATSFSFNLSEPETGKDGERNLVLNFTFQPQEDWPLDDDGRRIINEMRQGSLYYLVLFFWFLRLQKNNFSFVEIPGCKPIEKSVEATNARIEWVLQQLSLPSSPKSPLFNKKPAHLEPQRRSPVSAPDSAGSSDLFENKGNNTTAESTARFDTSKKRSCIRRSNSLNFT